VQHVSQRICIVGSLWSRLDACGYRKLKSLRLPVGGQFFSVWFSTFTPVCVDGPCPNTWSLSRVPAACAYPDRDRLYTEGLASARVLAKLSRVPTEEDPCLIDVNPSWRADRTANAWTKKEWFPCDSGRQSGSSLTPVPGRPGSFGLVLPST
jgi:hypothetical protein